MTLTERYFRLLGWRPNGNGEDISYWEAPGCPSRGTETLLDLPNIREHFPSFKQFVLEEMERRGLYLDVFDGDCARWRNDNGCIASAIIKDNEILSAAIEAAISYLEEQNGS